MKKIFMLPALFALAATGCGGDNPNPSVDVQWSQDVKTEMLEYLGMVLPYVQLDSATLYHGWDEVNECYLVGDESETNALIGYGDRLTNTGWTSIGNNDYTKTTEAGDLTLHYEWYEATEEYPCGNEIAVMIEGEGGGGTDEPVTGTYEFAMSDYGWSDAEVISSKSLAPGLTIEASKNGGSNDPKYYDNGASIRLYASNSITFSADNLTKLEFVFTRIDDNITFTPDSGTFEANRTEKTGVWTGEAASVTFTLGSTTGKQIRISKVTATGTFSGGDTPVDPGDERTIATIAEDIATNLGFTSSDIDWDGEDAYIACVIDGATSLEEACIEGTYYLPDYLEVSEEPAAGEWDDGDAGYFATYLDSENSIAVEIGAYLSGSDYVVQFCVYQAN